MQAIFFKNATIKEKEAMYVNNVIDFIAKKEREDRKRAQDLERYVATQCNFQHPENIDALVEDKLIEVKRSYVISWLSIHFKG